MKSLRKLSTLARASLSSQPGNIRGAVLVTLSSMITSVEAIWTRLLAGSVSIEQILFIRSAFQLVFVALIASQIRTLSFRTQCLGTHCLRGIISLACWWLFYYSFATLPLGLATILMFSSILFLTLLAGPILGEKIGWRRWSATIAGFIGVVIAMEPGGDTAWIPLGAAVVCAFFSAIIGLVSKKLVASESTTTILLYIGLITTLGSLPMALFSWRPLDWDSIGGLFILGSGGTLSMALLIAGWRAGEASVVTPFQYTRLIFSFALGYWLFSEVVTLNMASGALLICGSAVFIIFQETQRHKEHHFSRNSS